MMISLSEKLGPNLGSRKVAAEFRNFLLSQAGMVEIDCSGIQLLSHSFADELFGKLGEEFGMDIFRSRFQIKNLSPNDRLLVHAVIAERLRAKAS